MTRQPKEDKTYDVIMRLFHEECILCHSHWGITVHEIIPRSLSPKNWDRLNNRVTLCAQCHEKVHNMSKRDREDLLIPARQRAMKYWYALGSVQDM